MMRTARHPQGKQFVARWALAMVVLPCALAIAPPNLLWPTIMTRSVCVPSGTRSMRNCPALFVGPPKDLSRTITDACWIGNPSFAATTVPEMTPSVSRWATPGQSMTPTRTVSVSRAIVPIALSCADTVTFRSTLLKPTRMTLSICTPGGTPSMRNCPSSPVRAPKFLPSTIANAS